MRYKAPLEYQVLNLQEIAYRTGWDHGKRDNLQWAIATLRKNGYGDPADFLEGLCFGQAISGIKQASGFQPSQHTPSNQAPKVKAPDTSVQWPGQKP